MGYFSVCSGGMPVSGEVRISGAKNAALPILAAAAVCGDVRLAECPRLSDIDAAAEILNIMGFSAERRRGIMHIAKTEEGRTELPRELCGKMRSSILFIAPMLCRFGRAKLYTPGGCCLGARPVDMHISVLREMGAKTECRGEEIYAEASDGLKGAEIHLAIPSVGATETAVMAGACADGLTRIYSPALEPEIEDLCAFLNSAGADISFGEIIEIRGKNGLLGSAEHTVMPDRIEAGTYLAAAAITGGELFLNNTVPRHIQPFIDILEQMGCIIKSGQSSIYIDAPARLYNPQYVETAPYPLFPTDLQPQLTALLAVKDGECLVKENIFEARSGHIPQLNKMGADITVRDSRNFFIRGTGGGLESARVEATDLRCGAALVLAALTAKDGAVIQNGEYILRGYEDICKKMSLIGVKMRYKA